MQLVAIASAMNGLNFSVWIPGILAPVMYVPPDMQCFVL